MIAEDLLERILVDMFHVSSTNDYISIVFRVGVITSAGLTRKKVPGEAGLSSKERRKIERRWRKERRRTVPSQTATFRYLGEFHDEEEEKKRTPGKAFIPAPNEHLQGLYRVNADMLAFVQSRSPSALATIDMDATLVESDKEEALYCYKSFKGYQPLNAYWSERGMVAHSEFRDGNVPAGYQQRRVFEDTLSMMPEGIKKIRLRSDMTVSRLESLTLKKRRWIGVYVYPFS